MSGAAGPQPELTAGGQRLRPFEPDDVDWVLEVSLDAELQRWVDLPSPYTREHAHGFVHQLAMDGWWTGRRVEYLAVDANTGQRLGRVGLGLDGRGGAEIGYWVAREARGAGVAVAAARAVCSWAFTALELQVIEWRAEVGNEASRRVAATLGVQLEGTLRRRLVHRGVRVDAWVGSLLPGELR